ncbi:MAG: hypothetical protein B6I20_04625 [Bacteroidetes bacterium 4572_117]|nr:MAG: hypothetical protein B6I20_04625 [Bacteroidetes bacterium 4572_117]
MKKKAVILIITGIVFIGFGLILNNKGKNQTVNNTRSAKDIINQDKFNELINDKFVYKYFIVRTLNTDNKQFGNLKIEYDIKGESGEFYIHTEWIKENDNEFIITNLKNNSQNNSSPLFIVVGIAGKPEKPDLLYIIPESEIKADKIHFDKIEKFKKKNIVSNFYFDTKTKTLK